MKKVLEITNISKSYGNTLAVDNISLTVEEGDFFGFIGPNGAGKSTTINCVLNFIFQDEGHIKVFGLDNIKDSVEIKKHIGFVPGEVFYYDNMKVIDLLCYTQSFHGNIDKELLNKYIKLFNIPLEKEIGELSSGNKKKVAIVQSLLHKPKLLILDEPSSGLDPLMQAVLFKELEEVRKQGTTIFMSSHILSEVQHHCNKVAFIKSGKIIKCGNINDIINRHTRIIKITSNEIDSIKKTLRIKDVEDVTIEDNTLSFIYRNKINQLLKDLTKHNIKDLTIRTPDLDDLFITSYMEE
ncbi:MAG: ABC transporter ATP-binding protein [Bacilli bacterium]|nr:ABC transporter ATP-binding protein [Bacilli bacterium]MDD4298983.1 ABC transporter ATP-binding protein [Bacilli bacterium]